VYECVFVCVCVCVCDQVVREANPISAHVCVCVCVCVCLSVGTCSSGHRSGRN